MHTRNSRAYLAYLRGERFTYQADFLRAIPAYEEAVAIEPDYAQAHAALAMAHFGAIGAVVAGPESSGLVEEHVTIALALDPENEQAKWSHAAWQFFEHGKFQQGIDTLAEAVNR